MPVVRSLGNRQQGVQRPVAAAPAPQPMRPAPKPAASAPVAPAEGGYGRQEPTYTSLSMNAAPNGQNGSAGSGESRSAENRAIGDRPSSYRGLRR
jgi:hypothetical protein